MPKLGVITDGISREFEHALSVMNETGLEYAELQYLWEKEVGDLNDAEVSKVQSLIKAHSVKGPVFLDTTLLACWLVTRRLGMLTTTAIWMVCGAALIWPMNWMQV